MSVIDEETEARLFSRRGLGHVRAEGDKTDGRLTSPEWDAYYASQIRQAIRAHPELTKEQLLKWLNIFPIELDYIRSGNDHLIRNRATAFFAAYRAKQNPYGEVESVPAVGPTKMPAFLRRKPAED